MAHETSDPTQKLKLLPVHLAEIDNGIVIKRGRLELRIAGEEAAVVMNVILEETTDGGATREEICGRFVAIDRDYVAEMLDYLSERSLLVGVDVLPEQSAPSESSQEVYYWHFGRKLDDVHESLGQKKLAILGVNCISRQLVRTLSASGFTRFDVFDIPLLRNQRMFSDEGKLDPAEWPAEIASPHLGPTDAAQLDASEVDCLIASSDYGGQHSLRTWNNHCVRTKTTFLPIVLKDLIGRVGPLVIPGQTACLECLRVRQNSHFDDPVALRATDKTALEAQLVTGFHPAMASILGDVAAMELSKFYAATPKWNVGEAIEVNMLTSTMRPRKILKAPRCPVCSDLSRRSSATAARFVFLPGNQV